MITVKQNINQSQGPGNYIEYSIICNNCIQENPSVYLVMVYNGVFMEDS